VDPSPVTGTQTWLDFGRRAVLVLAADVDAERRGTVLPDAAADWSAAREQFAATLGGESAFATLVANAGLTTIEAEVLATVVACEMDTARQRLVAAAQDDAVPARLSLDSLNRLFGAYAGARAVGPDAILRRSGLVSVSEVGPWSDHRVAVHPTVVWALVGDAARDPDLPHDVVVIDSAAGGDSTFDVVTGADRQRRWRAGADGAHGDRFVATRALDSVAAWEAIVREATITGSGVIADVVDHLPPEGLRWIERADHLTWVLSSPTDLPLAELPARPWAAIAAGDPTPTDAEWAALLGEAPRTHRLSLDQLDEVARAYDAYGGDLDAAVRRLVGGRLEKLARRIRPSRTWGDLVLSPDRLDLLRSVVDRYRHAEQVYGEWGFTATPSRGQVALFAGPSGTGKTLAAEILAGELGLDVFKLDLSAVVSKYIGETEKNLEEVFDAASAGNLLLFFDEADSLFGKRSEVKDARDRYANIEVSYLLQRLEAYDGLVVMATNFERNIDDAFLRRIHTRIEFALPGPTERAQIWRRNLPPTAPVADLDIDWLAERFELSGGSIRNASIHAAFLAAAGGTAIDMRCGVLGVARELRKMNRLVKAADFGEHGHLLGE
jgi:hypothetical protein